MQAKQATGNGVSAARPAAGATSLYRLACTFADAIAGGPVWRQLPPVNGLALHRHRVLVYDVWRGQVAHGQYLWHRQTRVGRPVR